MEVGLLLLAMVSPFLYAATNHIDKILLERYFKEGGVETLIMFSALLSILAVIVLPFVDSSVLTVGIEQIALLFLVGLINTLLLWSYLKALFTEEPTVVIIFYQLVPVLGVFFAYLALGEVITAQQQLAMFLVIVGATIMSFAIDSDGSFRFRKDTVFYMSIAATCWALESTLFKVAALEATVWRSLFWEHVALVLVGVALFLFAPVYRDSFKRALRLNSKPIIGANVTNEVLYMSANTIAAYVVVLIPVSITLLMNGLQPFFVLVIGLLLVGLARSQVFAKLGVRAGVDSASGKFYTGAQDMLQSVVTVRKNDIAQIIIAIILTSIGIYLLGEW